MLQDIFDYELINTESVNISVSEIIIFLVILIVAKTILWILRRVFLQQSLKHKIEKGKTHSIYQIIKYFLWIVAITLGLEIIGVKVTLLVAGSAALLVGLGLGLQQIFKDIVSGFFLLFEGTIKIADVVELQGVVGKVKEISIRSTKIITRDNIIMIIPNSKFIEEDVINWSHHEERTRFHVEVGVAYGSDVELVKTTLLKCAENNPQITSKPSPIVFFNNFGDSALEFQLHFWTNQSFRVEYIKSDLRFEIDKAFRKNNIVIAFPQRDLHIKQIPDEWKKQ
jgi:small-conductance mechanosensitive channel